MKYLAISTGHSHKDPGAISAIDGTREFNVNQLLVAEILELPLRDCEWILIDKVCEDFYYPKHLTCTVQQINAKKKDIIGCVEIHHNSAINKDIQGGMALYWDSSIKGKMLSDAISFHLNHMMFFSFSGFKWYWRTKQHEYYKARSLATLQHIKRRLYYLKATKVPACIVEPGFLSNIHDLRLIKEYRKPIAMGIWRGICDWLEVMMNN